MGFLVNDIFDYSKIEAGKLTLYHDSFSPSQTISEMVNLMRFAAQQKKIGLKHIVDANVPANMISDEIRFKQILINLISNAIKFTYEGFIEVRAEL